MKELNKKETNKTTKSTFKDSVKYFVVDIKKEIIQCYNKFENK